MSVVRMSTFVRHFACKWCAAIDFLLLTSAFVPYSCFRLIARRRTPRTLDNTIARYTLAQYCRILFFPEVIHVGRDFMGFGTSLRRTRTWAQRTLDVCQRWSFGKLNGHPREPLHSPMKSKQLTRKLPPEIWQLISFYIIFLRGPLL